MPLESQFTEEQLFDNLISSLVHSVWISLGKIKNPISDKIERNLFAASMNIDMLDMLYKRMDGNLSEQEDSYLSHILSELKMNYLEEKKIGDDLPEDEKPKETKSAETKSKRKEKSIEKDSTIKQVKTKKPTVKPKDKK
ncbi:MAG: DUF1844 domain-containing protein [Candidatus Marinimicrobia bacterium]|nr:DUF1844 domain-containing protein [Candidatus Neomarinimicrobiota bacterium]